VGVGIHIASKGKHPAFEGFAKLLVSEDNPER